MLEQLDQVGGLARTTEHGGNRIDIGGHRFFTKSDRVMRWWLDVLPLEPAGPIEFLHASFVGGPKRIPVRYKIRPAAG